MFDQEVRAALVRLPTLMLGDHTVAAHVACDADLGNAQGPDGFDGILGPRLFENHLVITDPDTMSISVLPPTGIREDGHVIPLVVRRHGGMTPFATLVLPSGREVSVEVDTGSGNLIVNTRYMPDCGVQGGGPGVTTMTGTDETGYEWTRHWATITGEVHLAAAADTAQSAARVMFQNIIHDGLVGMNYLERFSVTCDVSGSRMVLMTRPESPG